MRKEDLVVGGIYKHFKGNKYRLLHIATHSETEEEVVVYEKLYGDHSIWVRPLEMFLDQKEVEGQRVDRFSFIDK